MKSLDLLERVRRTPVLECLPLGALDRLASRSRVCAFQPGSPLVREGEPGDAVYVILEGRVSVRLRLSEAELRTVAVRDAGDWVGEMALLDGAPRSATLVAETRVQALRIPREAFLEVVRRHAPATLELLRTVATRLRESDAAHIAVLTEKNQGLARSNRRLTHENHRLLGELDERFGFENYVGSHAAARRVRAAARHAAQSDLPVLLIGETGTGKELIARAIHASSDRAEGPFVAVNCGLLQEALLESELFGHARGAFTGASEAKEGLVEAADGGTLLLDEIAEMSRALQVSLLRFLELGEFRRVGETRTRQARPRVIAATSVDLVEAVERGDFRRDLLYRIDVIRIPLPPLRERREDVPELVEHCVAEVASRLGRPPIELEPAALEALVHYDFPGNVRELRNEIERLFSVHPPGEPVDLLAVSPKFRHAGVVATGRSYRQMLRTFKAEAVRRALEEAGGNRSRAAERLGVQRPNLVRMMRELGVRPPPPAR